MLRFTFTPNMGKYQITDETNRTLYSIKRRLRGGYVVRDANKYELYTLAAGSDEMHPVYQIEHNNKKFAEIRCVSKLFEPRMELEHDKQILVIKATSDSHLGYRILKEKKEVGKLEVFPMPRGELKFEFQIEQSVFDDFLLFIPLATAESITPITTPTK